MKTPVIFRSPHGSSLKRRALAALVVASLPLFTACGSSDPAKTSPLGSGLNGLPGYGGGGCVPITSQIPFIAQGAQTQFWGNGQLAKIVAGTIPQTPSGTLGILSSPGTYGTVAIGTVSASGGSYMLSRPEAAMQLAVTSPYASNTGYPQQSWGMSQTSSSVQATGFLQLTSYGVQNILSKVQYGQVQIPGLTATQNTNPYYGGTTGYTTINPSQICVSGLAFSLNSSNGMLGNGNIYLYLNGTAHGVVIDAL